eukprot:CAMPEP_0174255066 /NCGR_PEP_ID=MMETSP0439-20130205/4394_1 /TAXON_ID=0 /ORGANISM="Stereomyxa ramosa, Strain Chinc5" /LENGTH=217 /DNA_ID=CAMNT_0015337053 /DNA_START=650 /DNA_END=1303 /DNA_ORIENTATION=+
MKLLRVVSLLAFIVGTNCGLSITTPEELNRRALNGGPCVPLVEFQLDVPCSSVNDIWVGYFQNCLGVPIQAQCVAVDTHDGNCIVSVQEEEIQQAVEDVERTVYLIIPCDATFGFKGCVTRGCQGSDLSCCTQNVDYTTALDICDGTCINTACAVNGDKGNILRIGSGASQDADFCGCNCDWNFGRFYYQGNFGYGTGPCVASNQCYGYARSMLASL